MKKTLATVLSTAVVAFALGVFATQEPEAPADETARKAALAQELMDVTGAGELGVQAMEQMIGAYREMMPEVPGEFWDGFLRKTGADELEALVVPIYVKHLTVEEMQAAIDFFRSPVGQSFQSKMPVIMNESMQVGQKWGMSMAKELEQSLEEYRSKN